MKKTLTSAAVALLGVAAFVAMSPGGAVADGNDHHQNDHKVTICHATGSAKNPYTNQTVSYNSIDNEYNIDWNGHGDHEDDIIPAFADFPGLGDTSLLQYPDCQRPPTEVVVVPPTMTPPDCDAPGAVVLPEVTGLVYSTETLGDGSVKVTVKAGTGYVLADGSVTSWTFAAADLAQWAADDPRCVESLPPVVTPPAVVPPAVVPPAVVPPAVVPPAVVPPTEVGSAGGVVTPPAAVASAAVTPTALPATGGVVWPIFLIGLTALAAGIGAVRLARRTT